MVVRHLLFLYSVFLSTSVYADSDWNDIKNTLMTLDQIKACQAKKPDYEQKILKLIKKDQYKKATAILNGGIKKSDAQARYLMGILLNHLSYENLIDGTYYSIEPKNTETKNQAVDLLGKAAQQKYTKAYYDLSHFYQYDEKTNPPTYTTWNFPKTPATPVDC